MNVLVTGSRAPIAVLLARALHRAGANVYTADGLRPNFGQRSRAVACDFPIPSPRFEREACLAALARLSIDLRLDAIIPTCEETFSLSAGRAALPTQLLCPDIETLDRLHHKGRGVAFAASLGIPVPETRDAPDVTRDGILKRAYSRFSCGVIPLPAGSALPETDDGEWLWQAWVDGRALCTYSLCGDGKLFAHASYRTPYTVGLGAGVFYEAAESPQAQRIAQTLAEATGFTGSLSLDLIEAPDGALTLIEINPRATMGAALLTGDPKFGTALVDVIAGSAPPETPLIGRGRKQLKAAVLLLARGDRWRDWRSTPDVLADPDDPGPARAAVPLYILYALRARRLGLSPTAFTTHDIEWNGP